MNFILDSLINFILDSLHGFSTDLSIIPIKYSGCPLFARMVLWFCFKI